MKRLFSILVMFTVLGLSALYAKNLEFNLTAPAKVGATELAAGHYKIKIEGDTATFKGPGQKVVTLKVKMEEAGKVKFNQSAFTIIPDEKGGNRLVSVTLAGTTTKAVFAE